MRMACTTAVRTCQTAHPLFVLVVAVEGAVAATAVVFATLDDSVAAVAVDARPRRHQPGEVCTNDLRRVARIRELHEVSGVVRIHLAEAGHAEVRGALHPNTLGVGNLDGT